MRSSTVKIGSMLPFGKLILEAFMPEGGIPEGIDLDTENGSDWWFDHVYEKFSDRYGLC